MGKRFCIIAMAAVIGLSFAAPVQAGGIVDRVFNGGAKSLAKQTQALTKKAAELEKKAAEIEEKAAELSARDRRTYQEELVRLGVEAPEWLFNDAETLFSGAPEETEDYDGGILAGLARLVGRLFSGRRSRGTRDGGSSGATEAEVQAAFEAAQQILGGGTPTPPPTPAPTTAPPTSTPAPTTAPSSGGPTTWTVVADRPFDSYDINAIAYGSGRFIAGGGRGRMAYSADGRSWTRVADSTFGTNGIVAIAYGNNRWVAGGEEGKMAYSADGVTWTAAEDSGLWDYTDFRGNPAKYSILDIAWGNNRFVAVSYRGKLAFSADGARWTAIANSTFGTSNIYAVAYADNRFVAVDERGRVVYSTDGARWTDVADSTLGTHENYAIAWGTAGNVGGRFVAIGRDREGVGAMAYSSDGVRWTRTTGRNIDVFMGINAISYGNDRFVGGGRLGFMGYSTDGSRSTQIVDRPFNSSINAITYGNGRFVAGGEGGRIAYADW